MASNGYYAWVAAGKPWTLAAPLLQLQRTLQGYGFTVYAYPDEAHQKANLPEDHTAYSATGWPTFSPRWWAFAIDIMPKKSGGMAELTRMARQIIRDKDAGYPGTEWIKYINWTDEGGKTWQTSWKPNKVTRTSTDKGHTHISGRSDMTGAAKPYDPMARQLTPVYLKENDMQMLVKGFQPDPAQVWLVDGMFRRRVPQEWIGAGNGPITNAQTHGAGLLGNLGNGGAVFASGGDPNVWGIDVSTFDDGELQLTPEQLEQLGETMAGAVKDDLGNIVFEQVQRAEDE